MHKTLNFIMITSLVFLLSGSMNASELNMEDVHTILYRENVDLDAKSLKGWMRVFNSNSKLREYKIFVSVEEKEKVLLFLKELYTNEHNKYAKVVR